MVPGHAPARLSANPGRRCRPPTSSILHNARSSSVRVVFLQRHHARKQDRTRPRRCGGLPLRALPAVHHPAHPSFSGNPFNPPSSAPRPQTRGAPAPAPARRPWRWGCPTGRSTLGRTAALERPASVGTAPVVPVLPARLARQAVGAAVGAGRVAGATKGRRRGHGSRAAQSGSRRRAGASARDSASPAEGRREAAAGGEGEGGTRSQPFHFAVTAGRPSEEGSRSREDTAERERGGSMAHARVSPRTRRGGICPAPTRSLEVGCVREHSVVCLLVIYGPPPAVQGWGSAQLPKMREQEAGGGAGQGRGHTVAPRAPARV